MKNKKKKMIIRRIIKISLIVLIILLVITTFYYIKNKDKIITLDNLTYINNDTEWESGTVFPEGISALGRAYTGEMTVKDITKSMLYFSNSVIPRYYINLKNASDDEIRKYYEKNKELIYIDIGINELEDFIEIIKVIQKFKTENLNLESYRIDIDTIRTQNANVFSTLYLKYEGNDEINFTTKVEYYKKEDHSTVIYKAN